MPENQKPDAERNNGPLARLIAEGIQQNGPISVAEYMDLALSHPEHGYYISKNPFGAAGDFVTAPEISQMFGEMIGAWLVDIWLQLGRPAEVRLVELGPGRGTLAADIMRTITAWPDFKSAVKLHLVETSRKLREIQKGALKNYSIEWHDHFGEVPDGICLVIANEFFDALPIHQFTSVEGEWKERYIGYNGEKNIFYFVNEEGTSIESGIFELSPASLSILEDISDRIASQNGAALIIDYGHTAPGAGDTFQAVSKHQYSDPLENPGEKDLTAHVDFGTFKTVAEQKVSVTGPVTQGQFLIAMGIEARAQKLSENANDKQRQKIMSDIIRLVAPQEMGRLFKVMALTAKDAIIEPAGFGAHRQ
jgi:NADH dehydrogenase [ubiquinone] 1 alpha subcomplex assembly factor 7